MNTAAANDPPNLSDKVIPAQFIRIHDPHAAKPGVVHPATPKAAEKATEPKITLHKDGETIKAIEIVCGCGEVIKIDCEY